MLSSFVAPEDYGKLLDILTKIHDGTLRDAVSILLITGGYSSGKTTLKRIMEKLRPGGLCPSPEDVSDTYRDLIQFDNPIVYARDIDSCSETSGRFDKILIGIHETLNKRLNALVLPRFILDERVYKEIETPGTLVIPTTVNVDLVMTRRKRRIVQLNLPYNFRNVLDSDAIVDNCTAEFLKFLQLKNTPNNIPYPTAADARRMEEDKFEEVLRRIKRTAEDKQDYRRGVDIYKISGWEVLVKRLENAGYKCNPWKVPSDPSGPFRNITVTWAS